MYRNDHSADMSKPVLNIDKKLLDHWNQTLDKLDPLEILKWTLLTFPGLFQTTAFGLSGLCIIDMVSKIDLDVKKPELVFIDTLYHFPQTLELVEKIRERYCDVDGEAKNKLHVYKPEKCNTEEEFVEKYGDSLWESDELKYDYLVKIEPLNRAYKELNIMAVFTGRRKSQGDKRDDLKIVEVDETLNIVKINPLANWDFKQVERYVKDNGIPYNELLDAGYKSVGDWHSTQPVGEDGDERSGRWAGKAKTECGIHTTSVYSQYLDQKK